MLRWYYAIRKTTYMHSFLIVFLWKQWVRIQLTSNFLKYLCGVTRDFRCIFINFWVILSLLCFEFIKSREFYFRCNEISSNIYLIYAWAAINIFRNDRSNTTLCSPKFLTSARLFDGINVIFSCYHKQFFIVSRYGAVANRQIHNWICTNSNPDTAPSFAPQRQAT